MQIINKEKWNKIKEINSNDEYSAAIVSYAEEWANLMEYYIVRGQTIKQCAKETSHNTNITGLSGFMYGAAASMLSEFWVYGEEFRRWYNLDTQIGTEGEKANESGGVLNPALLNIEV